jgi:hypothetical protein
MMNPSILAMKPREQMLCGFFHAKYKTATPPQSHGEHREKHYDQG